MYIVCLRVCVLVTASTVIMWTFVAVHCALALAIRRNSIFHEAARQNEGPIKKKTENGEGNKTKTKTKTGRTMATAQLMAMWTRALNEDTEWDKSHAHKMDASQPIRATVTKTN